MSVASTSSKKDEKTTNNMTVKINNFKKLRVKAEEYTPVDKNIKIELLRKRIEDSKQRRIEAMIQQGIPLNNSSMTMNVSMNVSQLKNSTTSHAVSTMPLYYKKNKFDLQHVSPIIPYRLPNQSSMLGVDYKSRSQQKLSMQKEPDRDKVEKYKILQFKLK